MKHNVIRCSLLILVIGSLAVAGVRANAQNRQRNEIIIESLSWGISWGQTTRVSVLNVGFADGSVRTVRARIQLLDTEGEVIAQSGEMEVAPGKIRFWDVPREQLPPGEPTGRIQLRARIVVTTESFDPAYNPYVTVEFVETATGVTAGISNQFSTALFRPGHQVK
jgi:prepilin-type processing-associated H-X9-DG protein